MQLQRDDDLWEQLVALTLGDAQLTGELLDHAGGYIDPLRVVSQIPQHMQVRACCLLGAVPTLCCAALGTCCCHVDSCASPMLP